MAAIRMHQFEDRNKILFCLLDTSICRHFQWAHMLIHGHTGSIYKNRMQFRTKFLVIWQTLTSVVADHVGASGVVLARVLSAIVYQLLTVLTSEARKTKTIIAARSIGQSIGLAYTLTRRALVVLTGVKKNLTKLSAELRRTQASEV
ncbi:hypothetical protein BpHYR1_018526 [Brachionus plicatilis]|uniref:Uncharacterized protein n=1 Tax=Brachionus plicatilis TaxID=10195 RepID=A0A3M7RTF4_BRAPC|nr:hypothetical protein BpHYR1_018526 [Brachionus plicatilis]